MANEWILDVLADLKTFARNNGLNSVATGLDDLTIVAAAELASKDTATPSSVHKEVGNVGYLLRANGEGRNT